MKTLCFILVALLGLAANAQAPTAVPVAQEPGHHKVFENSYVRVLRVTIPANQSSLLHRHDADYVYVSLGPADVISAVQGKPEVHTKLVDGQIGFIKGGFVHVATAVGIPFNNVTIELLRPQGEPHNLCGQIIPTAPAGPCANSVINRYNSVAGEPQLATGEMMLESVHLDAKASSGVVSRSESLLVVSANSEIQITLKGKPPKTLHDGEVLWLKAGSPATVSNASEKPSSYLQLYFKDSGVGAAH